MNCILTLCRLSNKKNKVNNIFDCIIWKKYVLTCVHDISLYCIRYFYAVPTLYGILGCILGLSPTLYMKNGVFLGWSATFLKKRENERKIEYNREKWRYREILRDIERYVEILWCIRLTDITEPYIEP